MNSRAEIDRLIAEGAISQAAARIAELWHRESNPATAAFICSRYEGLREKVPLLRHRMAILRSFTVEPIVPLLRAAAFCLAIDLQVHVGDFNAYVQEILDSGSSLYRFAPDSCFLAVRTPDIAPELWAQCTNLSTDLVRKATDRTCISFEQWVQAFRERSQAALILHTLEQPVRLSAGVLDTQIESSQAETIHSINRRLRQIAAAHSGVYVLDYDALLARHGRLTWQDQRKYHFARLPISAENLIHVAREWLRYLAPLSGRTAKVLVVDLDNTLWGGVIGEDGLGGIKIGAGHSGAAYQELQRAILDLSRRGILLAICSKNNPQDALEAIDKHEGMLLRSKDFAAIRISWNNKVEGLREIAAELNLGIDSLVFLDDNPVEREQIRASLPEVYVIELPAKPEEYATTLRDCALFERLSLSPEDRQRTVMYSEQHERQRAEHSFQSKEDFYCFLEQEAEIAPVTSDTVGRVAQLTQKTNQFNLTSRHYAEQEISEMASKSECQVLSIRVRDRFGDHGLVGVAITWDKDHDCEIDTFLLSCRVIGRTVETALLSHIASSATARGCHRLAGEFRKNKKNVPARNFYSQHGFHLAEEKGEYSRWSLDLKTHQVACPEWIRLTVNMENTNATKYF